MKATGIVRRIDDLGRIVIPKEIRRTLRIRESDPLEIFTDREGEIILKKYSPIGEMGIPGEMSAAAMAVASCIGYSPSFWAFPLYGILIDNFEPDTAYAMIFGVLLVMSAAGVVFNTILGKKIVEHKKSGTPK